MTARYLPNPTFNLTFKHSTCTMSRKSPEVGHPQAALAALLVLVKCLPLSLCVSLPPPALLVRCCHISVIMLQCAVIDVLSCVFVCGSSHTPRYEAGVRASETRLAAEAAELGEDVDEDELLLERLDAGLFTLQCVMVVLAALWSVGDPGLRKRLLAGLHQRGHSLELVR